MARKVGNIMAPGEKFTGQNGEEKTRWIKCGVLLETDRGFRIKLDCLPVGGEGWFSVFEDDAEGPQQARHTKPPPVQQRPLIEPPEDDIPFS